ncbi:MAG: hypothetical protein AMXMBFR84_28870 [Candidatus Hydrogenedentota bacterium]
MQAALFETMARQIAAQCEAELATARAEASSILSEADKRIAGVREKALARARASAEAYAKGAHQMAVAEAEKEALSLYQALADEALHAAEAKLAHLAESQDFVPVLTRLLAELMPASPAGSTILVPPAHVDQCSAWLRTNGFPDVRVEPSAELPDGVAAQDRDRTYRITNALSTRFGMLRSDARKRCLKTLFAGKAGT